MAAIGLHHAALVRALGILDQQSSLGALDKADHQDQDHDHNNNRSDQACSQLAAAALFEQVGSKGRELGNNARHDDQRDTIADPPAGDLLTQPEQEHGATNQADNGSDTEHIARLDDSLDARTGGIAFQPRSKEPALDCDQENRAIARILVEFLAPAFAFLLDRLERGMKRGGKLYDDRGGNIGHDAERDQAHTLHAAAGEGVEDVDQRALGLRKQIFQRQRVDARQRNEAEKPKNDQGTDSEPDALAQLRGLGEIGEIKIARNVICA